MKTLLLAMIVLGVSGCVYDPGYSYVRPDSGYYTSDAGGYYAGYPYYGDGYYYDGGYYSDGYCCGSSVSIGVGYGYGYGGYPYGYGYPGYYYGGGYYHRDQDWDDDDHGHGDHDHDWHGGGDHDDHGSPGSPRVWNQPDHPPIPHRDLDRERDYMPAGRGPVPQPGFNQGRPDDAGWTPRPAPVAMPPHIHNAVPRLPTAERLERPVNTPRAPRNADGTRVDGQ